MSRQIRDLDEYERGSKWFAYWHREQPNDNAKMIDLDGVGYCHVCCMPIYLVEACRCNGGYTGKTATVTYNLANMAGLEMFVFARDKQPHRAGQIYVDWRTAKRKLGWVTEAHAWDILMSVRRTHLCQLAVQDVI
jgi:hypothetical protein